MQKPSLGFSDGDNSPAKTSNAAIPSNLSNLSHLSTPSTPSTPSNPSLSPSRLPSSLAPRPVTSTSSFETTATASATFYNGEWRSARRPPKQSPSLSIPTASSSTPAPSSVSAPLLAPPALPPPPSPLGADRQQSSSARSRRTANLLEKPSSKLPPRNGSAYATPTVPPATSTSSSTVLSPPPPLSGRPALTVSPLASASYAADRTGGSYLAVDRDETAIGLGGCSHNSTSTSHNLAKYSCLPATAIMDGKPPRSPTPTLRHRSRNPWSISLLTLSISLLGAALLALILNSLVSRSCDPKGCRMAYMYPSYIRLSDFDTEHTRFASKYSLYLYREDGFDDKHKLRGIPVLFIPGNAGSYKQVRPIAGEAAQHFHNVVQHDMPALHDGARTLDFFTVDFNEDITAFHGQTLLDQAEYLNEAIRYILSLYLDPSIAARDANLPDPTSVIILGHSMGGIVARTMLVMPNYQSNSINTIVTLSAPHARPPVTFDSEIVKLYDDINHYWRQAYAQKWANDNPLWHVTLVSIAGGGLDTVVPSDYAGVESILPDTHGFTVFTTTIPDVWTSMDHQAILWCDQFRKVMARTLFDIVDVHRPSQTKPRAERMRLFKKRLLTGLEASAERDMPAKEPTTPLSLDDSYSTIIGQGERLVLRSLGSSPRPQAHLLPVPPPGSPAGKRFTLLTDQRLDDRQAGADGDTGKIDVLFCSVFPAHAHAKPEQPGEIDPASTRLACKNATQDVITLPASRRSSRHPFSLDERESAPFSYMEYSIEHLADHQFVAVVDRATVPTPGFVVAEFSDNDKAHITQHVSLRQMLGPGLAVDLPVNRPMTMGLQLPTLQSSLLSYTLHLSESHACTAGHELFAPLVRQHVSRPFESKFYVNANARPIDVSLHGMAPYMPPALVQEPPAAAAAANETGLSFQFWADPTCNSTLHVRMRIDILASMGKLYMRYRTVLAAFPTLIVALVLQKQFRVYDEKGIFISFSDSLDSCLRKSIPLVLASLTLMSLSMGHSQSAPPPSDPSLSPSAGVTLAWRNVTTGGIDFHENELLVGTRDPFFWFLIPFIGLICVGVCTALNYATLALTRLLSIALSLALSRPAWLRHDRRQMAQRQAVCEQQQQQQQQQRQEEGQGGKEAQMTAAPETAMGSTTAITTAIMTPPVPPAQPPQSLQPLQQLQQMQQMQTQQYFTPPFIQSSPRRRVVTTMVLLLLVTTFIPYQFAYLVACLIQLATAVRALRVASDLRSTANYNFYNYAHSMLVLMLWILPINIPILVVWVRNLAVRWLTPFSSHHNVLSIMPFILLVETLTTGKMVPRIHSNLRHVTSLLLFTVAICAGVYGVSYAYMVHHLVNAVVAWLVVVHSTGEPRAWSVTLFSSILDDCGSDGKRGKAP